MISLIYISRHPIRHLDRLTDYWHLAPLEKTSALTVDLIAHPNWRHFYRAIEDKAPSASWTLSLCILKIKRNDGSKIIVGVSVKT